MSKNRNISNAKRLIKSGGVFEESAILRKTRCFKQVAAVIGEKAAMQELLRVVRESDPDLLNPIWVNTILSGAFLWDDTPQGLKFWSDINDSPKFPL